MRGHNLERCNQALEATTEVLAHKSKHIPKIVETIWTEVQNHFVMTNFPTTRSDGAPYSTAGSAQGYSVVIYGS